MNGVKFLFVIIILLYSCSAPRNIESSQREDIDVSKITLDNLKFDATSNFDFGSTKIQEIVFKRIEYFPPDTTGHSKVKTEEQMTITQKHDVSGTKSDTLFSSSDDTTIENIKATNVVDVAEEVAEDPYKWRYILGIITTITIIAIIIYIKFRGSKFISSICSIIKH